VEHHILPPEHGIKNDVLFELFCGPHLLR
jgi:hypothetical protein